MYNFLPNKLFLSGNSVSVEFLIFMISTSQIVKPLATESHQFYFDINQVSKIETAQNLFLVSPNRWQTSRRSKK